MPVYGTARRNMATSLLVQGVRRPGGQIRPDGRFDARHADGMTADPKPLLKMRDVGYERQRLEPPVI